MICVCTYYTNDFKPLYDITSKTLINYCNKFGHDFIGRKISQYHRHPVWYKIELLIELIDKYDYVLFIDCDAAITNNIPIDVFLSSKDIYLSNDINGLNSGVMLLKQTKWAKKFLLDCWNIDRNNKIYSGQFNFETTQAEQLSIIANIDNEKAEYLPQNIFNSYIYSLYNLQYPQGEWNENSFILHLAGLSLSARLEIFSRVLSRV